MKNGPVQSAISPVFARMSNVIAEVNTDPDVNLFAKEFMVVEKLLPKLDQHFYVPGFSCYVPVTQRSLVAKILLVFL